MSHLIKSLVKKIYSLPVVWGLLGFILRPKGVIVLMYHRVGDEYGFIPGFSVAKFSEHMHWIKKNCNVIHPDDFLGSLKKNKRYKPNVLITFDDGYHCCYKYAYPVLDELSLPALVFLATEPPDNGGMIWTDLLYYIVNSTTEKNIKLPWNEEIIALDSISNKKKFLSDVKLYLKNINNDQRIKYLAEFKKIFNVSTEGNIERQMLTWDEVRESQDTVSYGGHTHTHPIMSKVSEDDLEHEILTCKKRIFDETGQYPTSFAYPNGQTADYNNISIKLLKKHGFEMAYTTNEGFNDIDTKAMEIKRIPTNADNLEDFVWLISRVGQRT